MEDEDDDDDDVDSDDNINFCHAIRWHDLSLSMTIEAPANRCCCQTQLTFCAVGRKSC